MLRSALFMSKRNIAGQPAYNNVRENDRFLSFCVAALEEAPAKYGTPEIFNTDQGSQFTSPAFTGALAAAKIKISMDGRGRWMDNVFIERLWRSLKHEDIYLKGYADGREAKAGNANWIAFYNDRRLHQALGYRTPMAVWRERYAPRRLWTWWTTLTR
jgi:putative transposase